MSAPSNTASVLVDVPAAPSGFDGAAVAQGNNERVTLNWVDNSTNETGFLIQWSADSFATIAGSATVGAGIQTYQTGNIPQTPWYFRIQSFNAAGGSAWVNAVTYPIPIP